MSVSAFDESALSVAEIQAPFAAQRPRPNLSSREIEVLRAWILSDTKTEVCRRLYIAPGTVGTHIGRIRAKYTAVGRPAPTKAALVARALQDRIIALDEL